MALSEIIDRDLEGFLDLISTLATGTELLLDMSWNITGVDIEEQILILDVEGDTSMIDEQEMQ